LAAPPQQFQVKHNSLFNSFGGCSYGVRRELEVLRDLRNVLVGQRIVDLLITGAITQARIDDCLHGFSPGRRLPRRLA
jgi:hypothetical protein